MGTVHNWRVGEGLPSAVDGDVIVVRGARDPESFRAALSQIQHRYRASGETAGRRVPCLNLAEDETLAPTADGFILRSNMDAGARQAFVQAMAKVAVKIIIAPI